MKNKPKSTKIRLNLDITPQVQARILAIQKKTEAASATEVIRRALVLYEKVSCDECRILSKDLSSEIYIL